MIVVGLDLSLTGTGWALFEKDKEGQLSRTSGVIASKKKGMARLDEIAKQIEEVVPLEAEVFIENYGFGSKGQVVYQGELGGIIRYLLWKKGIKFTNVPPTVAKKFLTGSGVCEKSLILKELLRKYKINVDNDNEGDAIVLSLIGLACKGDIKITKAQQAVLEKLKDQPSN